MWSHISRELNWEITARSQTGIADDSYPCHNVGSEDSSDATQILATHQIHTLLAHFGTKSYRLVNNSRQTIALVRKNLGEEGSVVWEGREQTCSGSTTLAGYGDWQPQSLPFQLSHLTPVCSVSQFRVQAAPKPSDDPNTSGQFLPCWPMCHSPGLWDPSTSNPTCKLPGKYYPIST